VVARGGVQIEDEEQIADGAEHERAEDGADRPRRHHRYSEVAAPRTTAAIELSV